MRGQSSTTSRRCTIGSVSCAKHVKTTHLPHQTHSAAMANRTANLQVILIKITMSRKHTELISPNEESKQGSQGGFGFPLATLLGMPPAHQHSPGGKPDKEGAT